ncbi:phosphoribosyl transferase [bacterium]|nr:phosphoribosyl transferase [bacterium]
MKNLQYKTYADLIIDIKSNIDKLPPADLIVGIPRSGMVPAYMIGLALSKPVCSIQEFLDGSILSDKATFRLKFNRDIKNVIIIDDSVNTGRAMQTVRPMVQESGLASQYNIKYGAVYYRPGAQDFVDFALCPVSQPRMFQWNYLNHCNLEKAALDIDGVLCCDPTPADNDDGEKYVNFILNAKPLYIPNYKVAALVTSRLEKYRKQTEEWLAKNGVKYDKLYMLQDMSAEERRKNNVHAHHKAAVYKKLNNVNIFIESDRQQAKQIAELSGKLCFCATTDELFRKSDLVHNKRSGIYVLRRIIAACIPVQNWRRKIRGAY